jgi:hypothetical protein
MFIEYPIQSTAWGRSGANMLDHVQNCSRRKLWCNQLGDVHSATRQTQVSHYRTTVLGAVLTPYVDGRRVLPYNDKRHVNGVWWIGKLNANR